MQGTGTIMAGGGNARQKNDFYPTPKDVTKAFLAVETGWLQRHGNVVWEPARGEGAIVEQLSAAGFATVSSDIVDYNGNIVADFTKVEHKLAPAIVTNPPFRKGLAAEFVLKAKALDVGYIALVLKAQFFHTASRKALWEAWAPSVIYPLTWRPDFLCLGAPAMDFIWAVWDRNRSVGTQYVPLSRPEQAEVSFAELFSKGK